MKESFDVKLVEEMKYHIPTLKYERHKSRWQST